MYGGVAMVSCAWAILAYVLMPLGPTAGLSGLSAGQKNWCGGSSRSTRAPLVHSLPRAPR